MNELLPQTVEIPDNVTNSKTPNSDANEQMHSKPVTAIMLETIYAVEINQSMLSG